MRFIQLLPRAVLLAFVLPQIASAKVSDHLGEEDCLYGERVGGPLQQPREQSEQPPAFPFFDPPAINPPAFSPPAFSPPATNPPATNPPATNPPATNPPAFSPPAKTPPAKTPPAKTPPAKAPPATNPPATNPPATNPPATNPPATNPPATNPPATNPPATNPPATNPPATNPPATNPPATNPPATNPPATNPPSTNPPSTNPPSTNPPSTNPPSTNPPSTNPPSTNPPSTSPPSAGSNSGQATFYGGNIEGGACLFYNWTVPKPNNGQTLFATAISDANWAGSEACGGCVRVTGPNGNQIQAIVVDQCPKCGENHLDLFPDAFQALSNPSAGIIQVSWDWITCPFDDPIKVRTKVGTTQDWLSVQAVNEQDRIESMSFTTDGSTWTPGVRMDYNHFNIPGGSHTQSVNVSLTSVKGDKIEVGPLSCNSGNEVAKASGNFHRSP